jgi:hypothetical protein
VLSELTPEGTPTTAIPTTSAAHDAPADQLMEEHGS